MKIFASNKLKKLTRNACCNWARKFTSKIVDNGILPDKDHLHEWRKPASNDDLMSCWQYSQPGSDYTTLKQIDHRVNAIYHRNAHYYWLQRDSLIKKFKVDDTDNQSIYVAVANEKIIVTGTSLHDIRVSLMTENPDASAMYQGVFIARVGYEDYTFINDNTISLNEYSLNANNLFFYNEIVKPHDLEWVAQVK